MLMTTHNTGRQQCQLSRHYNADCFSCKEQEPNSERLYRWKWTNKNPPSLRSDQCYCTPVSWGVWCTVNSVFLVHHSSQIVVLESHMSVYWNDGVSRAMSLEFMCGSIHYLNQCHWLQCAMQTQDKKPWTTASQHGHECVVQHCTGSSARVNHKAGAEGSLPGCTDCKLYTDSTVVSQSGHVLLHLTTHRTVVMATTQTAAHSRSPWENSHSMNTLTEGMNHVREHITNWEWTLNSSAMRTEPEAAAILYHIV